MAKESEIQLAIRSWLKKGGILVERTQSGVIPLKFGYMHLASLGHPDLVAYLPHGKILFMEIKIPGKEPTADQVYYHNMLKKLGHEVVVLDSLEAAKQHFAQMNVHVAD